MKKIFNVLLSKIRRAILKDPNSTIRVEVTPQMENMEPFQVDVRRGQAKRTGKGGLICPTDRAIIYCSPEAMDDAEVGDEFPVRCATAEQGIFPASVTVV